MLPVVCHSVCVCVGVCVCVCLACVCVCLCLGPGLSTRERLGLAEPKNNLKFVSFDTALWTRTQGPCRCAAR